MAVAIQDDPETWLGSTCFDYVSGYLLGGLLSANAATYALTQYRASVRAVRAVTFLASAVLGASCVLAPAESFDDRLFLVAPDAGLACCDDPVCAQQAAAGSCVCKACNAGSVCASGVCRTLQLPFVGYCLDPSAAPFCANAEPLALVIVTVSSVCTHDGGLAICNRTHRYEAAGQVLTARLRIERYFDGVTVEDRQVASVTGAADASVAWASAVSSGLWCTATIAPMPEPCMTNQPGVEVVASGVLDAGASIAWGLGGVRRPQREVLQAVEATTAPFATEWAAEGMSWTGP